MRSKLPVTGNYERYPPLFGLGNGKTVSTPHCPEPKVLLASDKATITLYLLPDKEGGSRVKGWPFLALSGCSFESRF